MSIKKKLGLGIASAAIGISLVGGGTFAYFNDVETTNNTFAAGTLDLGIDKETIISIDNIKPGDRFFRYFQLSNDGSLDMKEILLNSTYEVSDKKGDNAGEDFGEHIMVEYLYNASGKDTVIFQKTLAEINENPVQVLKNFPAGAKNAKFTVQFEFVDNGEDQNKFQDDALKLTWTFDAKQQDGSNK
ncbi:TasA family protein [Cytobacillus solani]|uniref:Cell division protein FtsN n=1 Tax=Cytobacillus solani TaxID=1637975 RepID=A0A0Q3VEW5_9BACI|nr:TasA family protein [Cytobacillus solani]KOP71067.1 cell division protein FtsN [Bacillus sp. FJAT-21945]KQL17987.1 cell division protein FtsN [Cytobacillus solani]